MSKLDALRKEAEKHFKTYCCVVAPHLLFGDIHYEIMDWLQAGTADISKLLLLPRAHLKSKLMALYASWRVARNPMITILYISVNQTLVETQLRDIKNYLESAIHTKLWPDLIHTQQNKREKWDSKHIAVDHPLRKSAGIRDNTISAFSLASKMVGLHYDLCIYDDVVDLENSETAEKRAKVSLTCGMVASILNSAGETVAAGTTYHPQDLYSDWEALEVPEYEEQDDGSWVHTGHRKQWDVLKRVVEEDNVFLWPRTTVEGQTEGFDPNVLAKKQAEYGPGGTVQYHCQYYLNPNVDGESTIKRSMFQYYHKNLVKWEEHNLVAKGKVLKVVGGWDFADGLAKHHDYSCLVICGLDADNTVYILDIYKYKTDSAEGHFKELQKAYQKWKVRRIVGENNHSGKILLGEITKLCKQAWLGVKIDGETHTGHTGAKQERIANVLNHRYINGSMYHRRGLADVPELEDQLVSERPKHDDVKDALATALMHNKPPPRSVNGRVRKTQYDSRGGVVV